MQITAEVTALPPSQLIGRKLQILVVEDETTSAKNTVALLRLYGHTVDFAVDGSIALKLAWSYPPDVVLLDIGLPGIDGYEVARQLNAPSPGKKPVIIAITGYASEEDRRRSAEAGIHLHLTKPVDPEQLRAILERVERAVSW